MVQKPVRNHAIRGNYQHYARMTHLHPHRHVVPTTVLTRSRLVLLTAARHVTTVVPHTKVQHQRPTKQGVTKAHLPSRRPINLKPSPTHSNFHQTVTTVKATQVNAVQCVKENWVWKPKCPVLDHVSRHTRQSTTCFKDKEVIDSGSLRHMTRNISYLSDFEEIIRGYVAFGGNTRGGKITDTECIILSSDFKLPDDNHVLLRVPRENNMYNVDLKNVVPSRDLTCPFAKATLDESNLWHRRLGHTNFEIMNKLVKGNLVRGLPSKVFENNHTCVACKKGKQHRAYFKTKPVSSISQPLQRVLVTKPHNKTPYELLLGRTPSIGFMRPFSYPVTILNTLDPLGKFDGKADEGFLVGYSISSKAFRVFNNRTRIVQETLHINFLENQPNVAGSGPIWLFDIDTLTQSMNYQPAILGNQLNSSAGIQEHFDADKAGEGNVQQYVLFPLWSSGSKDPQNTDADATFEVKEPNSEVHVSPSSSDKTKKHDDKTKREAKGKSPVELSTGVRNLSEEFKDFSSNNTNRVNAASTPVTTVGPNSTNITTTFSAADPSNNVVSSNFELGGKSSYVDPSQYLDDPDMLALEDITYSDDEENISAEADFSNLATNINVSFIPTTRVHKDHPVTQIIGDLSSVPQTRSMTRMVKEQEPKRVHQALKDPSWIEAMKEELLQFKMQKVWVLVDLPKEEVYVCQPPGFEDSDYADKVYKVVKSLYGLHQALRAWCETLAKYLLENGFQRRKIDQTLFIMKQKGLQVKQKQDGIFISQDKYVAKILKKFRLTDRKSASTPIDTEKPLLKDPDVKRIFRYLKGKPHLGLWYPKDSPFNLVAYSDSDYVRASLDRKSTTGGCQFLGCRLISWQCKKQTVVATLSIEAEYVAAASCCAQVLWIQNLLLDYCNEALAIPGQTATGKENSNPLMADSLPKTILLTFIHGICINMTNDAVRLQALIDKRKVIITEDTVRQALRLDDADSINCLPNEEIFAELARMVYEKPSTKLTLYKAIFLAQ
nr:hypothetical protein [Tanacetum cinerariifolium]